MGLKVRPREIHRIISMKTDGGKGIVQLTDGDLFRRPSMFHDRQS